jgi:hypothetical protein
VQLLQTIASSLMVSMQNGHSISTKLQAGGGQFLVWLAPGQVRREGGRA